MRSHLLVFDSPADRDGCLAALAPALSPDANSEDVLWLAASTGERIRLIRDSRRALWIELAGPAEAHRVLLAEAAAGRACRVHADGDPFRPMTLDEAFACDAAAPPQPHDQKHCSICARPLEGWIEGMTQGGYCPACRRWAYVATRWPPIGLDRQTYTVTALAPGPDRLATLRAMRTVLKAGLLEARAGVASLPIEVHTGRAEGVLEVLCVLDGAGIASRVEPPFPWTAADAHAVQAAMGLRPAAPPGPFRPPDRGEGARAAGRAPRQRRALDAAER